MMYTRRKMKAFAASCTVILLFSCVGCSIVANRLVDGAVSGLGRAASEHAEQAVYRKLAPKEKLPPPSTPGWGQFMSLQAQIVFSYSFSAGGLWLGQTGYEPGEWTKFEIVQADDDTPVILERAFLKKEDNANEWWRVSWSEEDESWIYEALLSPSDGRLLRLRAKDAKGNEGEIPVTGQTIYIPPAEVTEESIEGATVGKENVTVPAGTFNTDHVVYLATTGEGKVEWWITNTVPGGVVKYLLSGKDEGVVWTSNLKAKGEGATTVLGSF